MGLDRVGELSLVAPGEFGSNLRLLGVLGASPESLIDKRDKAGTSNDSISQSVPVTNLE